ncbi:methyl-accepting chemotaxis protein [Curvibacter sp. HBC28]|uniref:Methyl-accepting chemotaxis protein n=2 Tax=Curvibacter microcysteis TaxID=3026419 RepID=A0ABT5MK17_9BURK|nr:methyl-accepting chemotaxis protein [Curvibacter sp. HBC28]
MGLAMMLVPGYLALKADLSALQVAQKEASGVDPARQTLQTIRTLRQTRTQSVKVLSGERDGETRLKELQQAVSQGIQDMKKSVVPLPDAGLVELTQQLEQSWNLLPPKVNTQAPTPQVAADDHTAVIRVALAQLEAIGDASDLVLDPEPGTYYLIISVLQAMPRLSETWGPIRGLGQEILQKGYAPPDSRERLSNYVAMADLHLHTIQRSLQKAVAADPHIASALQAPVEALVRKAQATLALTRHEITQSERIQHPPAEFVTTLNAMIEVQDQFTTLALNTLSKSLNDRIQAAEQRLVLVVSAIAFFALLAGGLMVLVSRTMNHAMGQALQVSTSVAQGDLRVQVHSEQRDETGHLLQALGAMSQQLSGIVTQVRASSDSIAVGTREIASGNSDLSERTESQARDLQQTSHAMDELLRAVQHNAATAQQANALSLSATEAARTGQHTVSEVVGTMNAITQAAKRIGDIIGVIDGIAFQTNILALNAAVEAARAGEHGRGFAVVAGEVRNLAKHSAQAAKEIKELIQDSVGKTESGMNLVQAAGRDMEGIVTQVNNVSQLVQTIAQSASVQTQDIAAVGQALQRLDQGTQQNAALVEESAAAAVALRQQAQQLLGLVSSFRLEGDLNSAPAEALPADEAPALPSSRGLGHAGRPRALSLA